MILKIKALLTIVSAVGLVSAQFQCRSDNDCPGSEVCCSANFGEGGEASLCIAQNSCVNGLCFESFGGRTTDGTCDGG